MLKAKIAVLVSGGGTNLQALIDAVNNGTIKQGEIAVVISNNADAFALTRAYNSNIPREVVLKAKFPKPNAFENEIKRIINEYGVDLIVLAGFMHILSKNFTSQYPKRIINVHPSLIPAFCGKGYYGLKVHEAALKYGVKVTGATVHFVNEVPDGGEIILQKAVNICRSDTPESLQQRVMRVAEWKLLPKAVEMVSADIVKGKGEKND